MNVNAPVLAVKHSELERFSDESAYKSICPACKNGLLLVYRNSKTLALEEYDRCILCGQQYKYLDIEELKKKESH